MDDNHSTQPSSEGDSQLTHTRRRNPPSRNFLVRVVQRSWLIWLILWLLLMLAAGFSIFSLTYTGLGTRPRPLPSAIVVETPVRASSRNDSYIALWVLGAIIACGAGYWVVFQQLKEPPRSPKRQKRLRSHDRRQQRLNLLKEVQQTSTFTPLSETLTPVEPKPGPSVVEPETISTPENDVDSVPEQSEPLVTILPPENNSHVDIENISLVEMMDMRKHRSLSSLLGEDYNRQQHEDSQTPRQGEQREL